MAFCPGSLGQISSCTIVALHHIRSSHDLTNYTSYNSSHSGPCEPIVRQSTEVHGLDRCKRTAPIDVTIDVTVIVAVTVVVD